MKDFIAQKTEDATMKVSKFMYRRGAMNVMGKMKNKFNDDFATL